MEREVLEGLLREVFRGHDFDLLLEERKEWLDVIVVFPNELKTLCFEVRKRVFRSTYKLSLFKRELELKRDELFTETEPAIKLNLCWG